jgi:hypothetical protein
VDKYQIVIYNALDCEIFRSDINGDPDVSQALRHLIINEQLQLDIGDRIEIKEML